jgi:FHA domain
MVHTLNAAYAAGLISENTLAWRLERLLRERVIDPAPLIGDLSFRDTSRWRARGARLISALTRLMPASWAKSGRYRELLLALDWTGGPGELLIGRHYECDVVLSNCTVSRRHARLVHRDGTWILQDLESTNGTTVNAIRVGRCELRPGDLVTLGSERLRID